MIDPSSPFASFGAPEKIAPTTTVHVNFCTICHYVWKAPTAAQKCVNCTNPDIPLSLVSYTTEVPIT